MAHKVHPKAFRLKETSGWDSRWLSKKNFSRYLERDFKIREFLGKRLKDAGVQNIEIERFPGKVSIIINAARPGLIIGRGGAGAEELKKEIVMILKEKKSLPTGVSEDKEIKVEIKEVQDVYSHASFIAQWIAQQLERRIPHRRALKQALDKVMSHKAVKGVRVEVAGRLGGSEIARREWLQKGRLPRQTLRADIDYAQVEAYCAHGVIGVKVWTYKGERFE